MPTGLFPGWSPPPNLVDLGASDMLLCPSADYLGLLRYGLLIIKEAKNSSCEAWGLVDYLYTVADCRLNGARHQAMVFLVLFNHPLRKQKLLSQSLSVPEV